MYNFRQYLQEGENILYECHSELRKKNNRIGTLITGITIIIIQAFLLCYLVKILNGELTITFTIVFFLTPVVIAIILPEVIYQLFIKRNLIIEEYYCITNLRAMSYEVKKISLWILSKL